MNLPTFDKPLITREKLFLAVGHVMLPSAMLPS